MNFAEVVERLQKLENPYPGLRPFETRESHLFFGRDQQTAELVGRLERNRFLAVLGVSGSGKSSLVRAGLIPALERGRAGEAGKRWRIVVTRPAGTPFESLGADLAKCGLDPAELRRSSHGLIEVARQLAPDESLLVVVDQFEELFRYKDRDAPGGAADPRQAAAEAAEFVQLLLASSLHYPPVYIVLTMRSDYLGDCAEFRDLPETLNDCQYLVPRMTREQRREAIEVPLGTVEIAPSLVQRLLNDAGDEPDQLPILQHALMRTWDHWRKADPERRRRIELQDYLAIGGFEGALDQHADELRAGLPPDIVSTVFKRLTARGQNNRERRDPATLAELWAICGAETPEQRARVTAVIDRFRQHHATFLYPRDGAIGPDTYIDIAHESLIRQWKKLRDEWLPEEHKSAKTFLELAARARAWKAGRGEVLFGLDLADAFEWDLRRNKTTVWAEHYAAAPDLAAVIEFKTASLAEKRRRARRAKRNFWLVSGAAVLFAVLAGVAMVLWYSAQRAREAADRATFQAQLDRKAAVDAQDAESQKAEEAVKAQKETEQQRLTAEKLGTLSLARQLAARSDLLRPEHMELAALLATEAMLRSPTFEGERAIRAAVRLLPRHIAAIPRTVVAAAFSPDGRWLAIAGADKTTRVYEGGTGRPVPKLPPPAAADIVVFSPDSRWVLTGSRSGGVRLFETASGREAWRRAEAVNALVFSPDGRWIAAVAMDRSAGLLEAGTGKQVWRREYDSVPDAISFSGDGRWAAIAAGAKARILEVSTGNEVWKRDESNLVSSVALSAHGDWLAITSGAVDWLFNVRQGQEVSRFTADGGALDLAFSHDGRWVAIAGRDAAVLVELAGGKEVWRKQLVRPTRLLFSEDGRYLVFSDDNRVQLVEAATGNELWERPGLPAGYLEGFTADGRRFFLRSFRIESVWDVASGTEIAHHTRHESEAGSSVAFSPATGRWLVPETKTARLFELPDDREGSRLVKGTFDADGRWVESGVDWRGLSIPPQRPRDRKPKPRYTGDVSIATMELSADRRWLVTGGFQFAEANIFAGGGAVAWITEVATGKVSSLEHPFSTSVTAANFSADGRWIATACTDGAARVFATAAGGNPVSWFAPGSVTAVALSKDGGLVATGGSDKTARVFQRATGKEISRITLEGPVVRVRFIEAERYLMTASTTPDGNAVILARHPLKAQDLIADACSRVTRNLTHEEWKQYVGAEIPYRKTCPNLP